MLVDKANVIVSKRQVTGEDWRTSLINWYGGMMHFSQGHRKTYVHISGMRQSCVCLLCQNSASARSHANSRTTHAALSCGARTEAEGQGDERVKGTKES